MSVGSSGCMRVCISKQSSPVFVLPLLHRNDCCDGRAKTAFCEKWIFEATGVTRVCDMTNEQVSSE